MTAALHSTKDTESTVRPRHLKDLFWSFNGLALQGFGGVVGVAQRVLVEDKRWLTHQEFIDDWAVAQVLPGPNVVNLGIIIGSRYFGLKGAMMALAGMFAIPLVIVLLLAGLYDYFSHIPQVAGALRGMTAVSAGLIMGAGLRLVFSLKNNVLGVWLCALASVATFVMVGLLRWPQTWVLLGLGLTMCVWAWVKLKQALD